MSASPFISYYPGQKIIVTHLKQGKWFPNKEIGMVEALMPYTTVNGKEVALAPRINDGVTVILRKL